jgi:carbon-monoxide dehydrogenase iron sulfur subunit
MERKIIYTEIMRCLGCKMCELACAVAHSPAKDIFEAVQLERKPQPLMYVEDVQGLGIPVQCMNCENAPCAHVCPTKALYLTDEGIVGKDESKCVGCKACVLVCPFGVIRLDVASKTVVKCDLCKDRLAEGKPPACVESCPVNARSIRTLTEIVKTYRKHRAQSVAIVARAISTQFE